MTECVAVLRDKFGRMDYVQELIRCKECKYMNVLNRAETVDGPQCLYYCNLVRNEFFPVDTNDFCSFSVRKEIEQD